MMRRYILAPEAAHDLVRIWRYLKKKANVEVADRVELAIREKVALLAKTPGAGHWRNDLTDNPVKFLSVYSYLIVYRPETKPLRWRLFSTEIGTLSAFSPSACPERRLTAAASSRRGFAPADRACPSPQRGWCETGLPGSGAVGS